MKFEKINPKFLLFLLALLLSAFAGYSFGSRGYVFELKKNPPAIQILNPAPLTFPPVDFSPFWEAWRLLQEKSLARPLNPQNLLYGAIRGLAGSLEDPYTVFLTPEQAKELEAALNGQYEGIGAELGHKDGQLVVIAPLQGSPAQRAGIRPGDRILKIEEKETAGLSLGEAVTFIRGREGTVVSLTIEREKEEPLVLKIKREKITVPALSFEKKEEGIVSLRLSRFGEDTNAAWDKVMAEILKEGPPRVFLLDLRGNAGGYLESAVYIAAEFIPEGELIVSEQFGDGTKREFLASRWGRFLTVPLVILLNKGSASAAEILAAALKEQRGAKLVGENSFGKGLVQEALDLKDGSKLHVTVARWLTPEGKVIQGQGLAVDFRVDSAKEEFNNGEDPVLIKALEVAKTLVR